MNRTIQAMFYAFLFTMFGGSIYYALGVAVTLAQGGDVVEFFTDTVIACTVLWLFLSYVFYDLAGAFERMNKRDTDDNKKDDGDKPEGK